MSMTAETLRQMPACFAWRYGATALCLSALKCHETGYASSFARELGTCRLAWCTKVFGIIDE